jgi:hypothetical protein
MQMSSIQGVNATVNDQSSPQSTPVVRPSAATETNPEFQVVRDPDTHEFVIFVRDRATDSVEFQLPAEDIVVIGASVGLNDAF